MQKQWIALMVLAGVLIGTAVASAACGGGENSATGNVSHGMDPSMDMSTPAGGQRADVVVDLAVRNLRYEPASIEVPVGKTVQINLRNMDGAEHDMTVDGLRVVMMGDPGMAGHHAGASAGMLAMHTVANGNASVTFRADEKGLYRFYCTLPGHKDAGMIGEMRVI